MNIPSWFLQAPPTSAQMSHNKLYGFIKKGTFSWIIQVMITWLALFSSLTSEEKVETPSASASSGLWCISDCATCPVICSPPPPILVTKPHPPPSPSVPHSPSPSYFTFSPPPPPKSQSPPPPSHPSAAASAPPPPPPPFKPYNTPPSGSSQPLPTVIAGPHDFSYPYYYFYASGASSLSILAPFFVLLFSLFGYSIVGN